MARCSLLVLAVLSGVLACGCGHKDPPPPQPLTPEEEQQFEDQLRRSREQEGQAPRGKEGS